MKATGQIRVLLVCSILVLCLASGASAYVRCSESYDAGFHCDVDTSVYCQCDYQKSRNYNNNNNYNNNYDDDDGWFGSSGRSKSRNQKTTSCSLTANKQSCGGPGMCDNGKCLSQAEVCGLAGTWGTNGTYLNYESPTCRIDDVILPAAWKTWKTIQDDDTTLARYMTGVSSDKQWFNRQFDTLMFVVDTPTETSSPTATVTSTAAPTAADNTSTAAPTAAPVDPLPVAMFDIIKGCQDDYESFTCMRNLPGCTSEGSTVKGKQASDKCLQACEAISTECFAKFYTTCEQEKVGAEGPSFQCKTLLDAECWEPWCIPETPGVANQGWSRDCKLMCDEYQPLEGSGATSAFHAFQTIGSAVCLTLLATTIW